ncbi:MAG: hypothetical protein WDM91_10005 [Rhizomicrobium sp.]
MIDIEEVHQAIKRIRNGVGLLLMVAWVVYWWHSISAAEQAALAALPQASGLIGVAQSWWDRGGIESGYGFEKFVCLITAPFMFIPAHYFARWYMAQKLTSEFRRADALQRSREQAQAQGLETMRRTSEREADATQAANRRHELVTRIGDVDSQLLIYEGEQDQDRRTRMLLNLTQYIYELHAKYPGESLQGLLSTDPTLAQMTQNTLAHMRTLGLQSRNFYTVLSGFVPVQSEPEGERPALVALAS